MSKPQTFEEWYRDIEFDSPNSSDRAEVKYILGVAFAAGATNSILISADDRRRYEAVVGAARIMAEEVREVVNPFPTTDLFMALKRLRIALAALDKDSAE